MDGLLNVLCPALELVSGQVFDRASRHEVDLVGVDIFDRLDGETLVVLAADLNGFRFCH